ncbi:MAG: response regulator transcription factor [Syntrophorhabdaceae bacterium]|nr:response regulator transcription factor [Syntrophorhabdaceae bacterium]MDD4196006.1 response regulator transcription factor [Syntrophorhabdaceae bacterium]
MKVLVVEDEVKVSNFIMRGLEEEGYTVEVAEDGKKGLDLITAKNYDIILLDLMIPEMDGLEVLKRMRQDEIETPVLIITAKSTKEDVIKGLDTGSDDYLTKPFSFDELLARMRALLRRSRKAVPLTLEYQDMVLNPYNRKLSVGDRGTELTEKEFLIMEYMMRNYERPLTRKEMAEYAWQSQDDSSNIVDVYVNFLRKKIELLTDRKFIHTVRGVGYILKEGNEKL